MSNNIVYNIGSISDWVSALSTLGTFVVAYRVYKIAPSWFKEKAYEEGYDISKRIIYTHIRKILTCSNHFRTTHIQYKTALQNCNSYGINDDNLERLNKKMDVLFEYRNDYSMNGVLVELNNDIRELNKLGWKFNPYYIDILTEIQRYIEIHNDINYQIVVKSDRVMKALTIQKDRNIKQKIPTYMLYKVEKLAYEMFNLNFAMRELTLKFIDSKDPVTKMFIIK